MSALSATFTDPRKQKEARPNTGNIDRGVNRSPYRRQSRRLVQGAHYILGPFGQDSDLRRWGLKLSERGGRNAKKRAVVAVARKLAVLLHKLWVSKEVYEPLRNNRKQMAAVA
jgi:transposase